MRPMQPNVECKVEGQPFYELILRAVHSKLALPKGLCAPAIGILIVLPGLIVAAMLGVFSEFVGASLRLPYWGVIGGSFMIMHSMYELWQSIRQHIESLYPVVGDHSIAFERFERKGDQWICAICTMAVVSLYFFVLQPQIPNLFIYWYVYFSLLIAGFAASFGLYFGICVVRLLRHISRQQSLNVNFSSPAHTPGIIALNSMIASWSLAYAMGLLIILCGIILGPWGTTINIYRLMLAGGAFLLTACAIAQPIYAQYLLYRTVERERLRCLSDAVRHLNAGIGSAEGREWSEIARGIAESPTGFTGWQLLKSVCLTVIPWALIAGSRWAPANDFATFALKQLGFQ